MGYADRENIFYILIMKLAPKIIITVAAFAILATGFYIYKRNSSKQELKLETATVLLSDIIQEVTATGRLQPIDQVDVGTEVSGTVSKVYADFNQTVKRGQILLEIDPQKAKARVQQMRAAYKSAENEMDYQKKNHERLSSLHEQGAVTKADLEQAEYRFKNAESSLVNAKSNLEQAELDLQNCIIKSPIDGVVLDRTIESGQTVAASFSAPTLFTLARSLTQMEVKADVDEADIGLVKIGQRVEFSVDAFSGKVFHGEVKEVRLSPSISSNVVTYTVIILAENQEQKLLPGMTANCRIIVNEVMQVPTIPVKALQFKPGKETPGYSESAEQKGDRGERKQREANRQGEGGKRNREHDGSFGRVWVVGKDERLTMQRVVLGISDGTKTQVIDGLTENTVVATGVTSTANAEKGNAAVNPFMPQRQKGGMRTR